MKKYELIYIVHPDLEDTLDKVMEKISGYIKKKNGNIISEDNWGKRKLAYPVKKNSFGIYVVIVFELETKDVRGLEKTILVSEEIIRHLIIAEDTDVEKRKTKAAERKARAEENEKPQRKTTDKEDKKIDLELGADEEEKEKKEPTKKDEKERLKELDEKLDELLGDDKE